MGDDSVDGMEASIDLHQLTDGTTQPTCAPTNSIMVEKGSGRSRGFGFVSYDAPEGAALAIQMMDGYQVR